MVNLGRVAVVGIAGIQAFGTSPHHPAEPECPADLGPITFAIEHTWGQWSKCHDENGEVVYGHDVHCEGAVQDVYKHVCNAAGLVCNHNVVDWSEIWDGGKGSGYHTKFEVAAAARITDPRQEACMVYSNPYTHPNDGQLIARDDFMDSDMGGDFTACAKLGDAIGAPQLNAMASDMMANNGGQTITVHDHYETQEALEAAIVDGQCHVGLFDGSTETPGLKHMADVPVSTATAHQGAAFMLDGHSARSHCIIERLNQGLSMMHQSGELTGHLNMFQDGDGAIDKPLEEEVHHVNHLSDQCAPAR